MTDKIIELGKATDNGQVRSPAQMLEEALLEFKDGALKDNKKALILTVNQENGSYIVNWFQAGMTMSECNNLCDFGKDKFKEEMRFFDYE